MVLCCVVLVVMVISGMCCAICVRNCLPSSDDLDDILVIECIPKMFVLRLQGLTRYQCDQIHRDRGM